ncbi:phospholipase A [Hydrogenimonas sp.]
MKHFLVIVWLGLVLFAQSGVDPKTVPSEEAFQKARMLLEMKKYAEAVPYLERLAKHGNKAAMYQLAVLYEKGLGVKKSFERSSYWYKQVASNYAYIQKILDGETAIFSDRIEERFKAQFKGASSAVANEAMLANLQTDTKETRSLLEEFASGKFFGLQPYKANYLLPASYASSRYRRQPSAFKSYKLYDEIEGTKFFDQYGTYDPQTEVEFQLSLMKNLTYNLFGLDETIAAAYTQHSYWQLYSKSSPFRETNYSPEVFVVFPTSPRINERFGLKATRWGYLHQSNGQEGYRSRSWNRLYLQGLFQWENLFLTTRVWYRVPESDKPDAYYRGYIVDKNGSKVLYPDPNEDGDDNPDIIDYMGYGDIAFTYLWHCHQFGGLLRYNFGKGGAHRGAVKLDWSYPFFESHTIFWYLRFFSGYGESLIDYNKNYTKASFGFSFSRGIAQ